MNKQTPRCSECGHVRQVGEPAGTLVDDRQHPCSHENPTDWYCAECLPDQFDPSSRLCWSTQSGEVLLNNVIHLISIGDKYAQA